MLAIGGAAGAASFTHVHNVAAAHGQPGWLAWADAIVLELMSVASGLELRRRKRAHTSTMFPAVVLGCAVTLSLAAQVVEAESSPIGWIAAAVPALGFLVMVKVALGYTGTTTRTGAAPSAAHQPDPTPQIAHPAGPTEKTRSAGPAGEQSTTRTVHPSSAAQQPDGRDRRRRTTNRGQSTQHSRDADELLPASRSVRNRLAADGQALTRAALAEARRATGHTVSNTRVSELLKTLKAESSLAPGPNDVPTPRAVNSAPSTVASRQPAPDTSLLDHATDGPTAATSLDPTNPNQPHNGQENPDLEHRLEPS